MDQADKQAIEQLFERIRRVAQRSGPRDRGAEAFINAQIEARPEAAYYMAQTIIAQEQALNAAQDRIDELEEQSRGGQREAAGEGFFGGLFGSRGAEPRTRSAAAPQLSPWDTGRSGGFLGGAAQTAMGVAGGVVLGNMLANWLSPDQAGQHGADDALADDGFLHDADQVDVADASDLGDFDFGDF